MHKNSLKLKSWRVVCGVRSINYYTTYSVRRTFQNVKYELARKVCGHVLPEKFEKYYALICNFMQFSLQIHFLSCWWTTRQSIIAMYVHMAAYSISYMIKINYDS